MNVYVIIQLAAIRIVVKKKKFLMFLSNIFHRTIRLDLFAHKITAFFWEFRSKIDVNKLFWKEKKKTIHCSQQELSQSPCIRWAIYPNSQLVWLTPWRFEIMIWGLIMCLLPLCQQSFAVSFCFPHNQLIVPQVSYITDKLKSYNNEVRAVKSKASYPSILA